MAARVKSIISGDTIVIVPEHLPSSEANERQLSLAYVSAPEMAGNDPSALESREYLQSILAGKTVDVEILYSINGRDYGDVSTPPFDSLIEQTLATGFVKLDDDAYNKSGYEKYQKKLEVAQKSAQSAQSGIWTSHPATGHANPGQNSSDKDKSTHFDEPVTSELQKTSDKAHAASRVVDATKSTVLAKRFLQSLRRREKIPGVVDFVLPTKANRMTVVLPSEGCMITIVLAGITVPHQGETGFEEAVEYITRNLSQKAIQVSVQDIDVTNAFISLVYVKGSTRLLSSQLVALGLVEVDEDAAIAAGIYGELETLESRAIAARKGIWANYDAQPVNTTTASSVPLNTRLDAFIFASQHATSVRYRLKPDQERFEQLEKDMNSFYSELKNPLVFDESPPKGTFVAVQHHGSFVRGEIVHYEDDIAEVELIDYSENITLPETSLKQLSPQFLLSVVPKLSGVASLTYVCYPIDDYAKTLRKYVDSSVVGKYVVIYFDTPERITLFTPDSKDAEDSLNSRIITEGYTSVLELELEMVPAVVSRLNINVSRYDEGDQEVVARLKVAQEQAKSNHIGMWEYGDPRYYDDHLGQLTTDDSLEDPLLGTYVGVTPR